jgi:hypothetical protein
MSEKNLTLGEDVLVGAAAISGFMFGRPQDRRRVYYLAERKRLPVFHLGAVICARRSVLVSWISNQEAKTFDT